MAEDLNKLPKWAQNLISKLEADVKYWKQASAPAEAKTRHRVFLAHDYSGRSYDDAGNLIGPKNVEKSFPEKHEFRIYLGETPDDDETFIEFRYRDGEVLVTGNAPGMDGAPAAIPSAGNVLKLRLVPYHIAKK